MAGFSFIDFSPQIVLWTSVSCHVGCNILVAVCFVFVKHFSIFWCHSLTFRASRSHQKDRCWQYCSIIMALDKTCQKEKSEISRECMRCVTLIRITRQGVMIKVVVVKNEHSDRICQWILARVLASWILLQIDALFSHSLESDYIQLIFISQLTVWAWGH